MGSISEAVRRFVEHFTGDLDAFTIDKTGGSKLFDDLPIDSYVITETVVPGYVQSVSCTNESAGINSVTLQPLIIFGTVAAAYFAVCWPLSLLSRHLEHRLAH